MTGINYNMTDEILAEQKKIFKIYPKLPLIVSIITLVLFIAWGIIDPYVVQTGKDCYGVMKLSSGVLCGLIWAAIGAVVATLTYFVLEITLSYKILHIRYLEKILNKLESQNAEEIKEELQTEESNN